LMELSWAWTTVVVGIIEYLIPGVMSLHQRH
jgi:hypothetical protein